MLVCYNAMTTRDINNTNAGLKAFRYNPALDIIWPTPVSATRLDNFAAPNKGLRGHFCNNTR